MFESCLFFFLLLLSFLSGRPLINYVVCLYITAGWLAGEGCYIHIAKRHNVLGMYMYMHCSE